MLKLMTFPAGVGEPSHSPFCVKAMVLLQMSGQPWDREDVSNPSPMPHGKLPVLRVGETLIPDSEFIQDWLTAQGADFYPNCTAAQKAQGHAIVRMVEEGLRLALVHDRWLDARCWSKLWPLFFAEVPRPLRKLIATKAHRSVKAGRMRNGFARMSAEQRLEKSRSDLEALGQIIGTKDFMLGDAPTGADAAVLPVLSMIDRMPVETELTRLLRAQNWANGYLQRGRATFYRGLVARQ